MRATKSLGYRTAVVATMTAVLVGAGALPALAAPYRVSIADVTVTEGNAGSASANFTIRYGGPPQASTVNWAAANQTATAGSDYTASSGTASLPAGGCKCVTVTVPVLGDLLDESTETFVVNLSNQSRGTIQDGQGVGTILDNDATPSASVADVIVDEDGGPLTFTVQLSNPSASTVTIGYATSNGSATAGSDYTATSGTLTFVSPDVSETVAVTLLDDTLDESNETLDLTLSSPVNATIGDGSAVGTIVDDDPPPTLSVGDASVGEPAGTATASFAVSLSKAHPTTVTVNYATANGSATAGADYTAASGTLTFVAGDTSETVDVTVLADPLAEDDETFDFVLSGPTSGIPITDGTGVGTIIDDGDPDPAISIGDASVGEGGSLTFTVTLDAPAGRRVTVDFTTADGSALDGSDYTASSGTLTFVAGDTSETVTVATTADATYENDEDLSVSLSAPTNATIADGIAVGTILNDDAAPTFSVNDISVNEDDGTATFTVTKTGATAFGATVDVATADVTATAGADYVVHVDSLTFGAGVSSMDVVVTLSDDLVHDGTEFFTLELSNPSGATITAASGTATITEDETPPTISINDVTTVEGDAGTTTATFTVTLTGPTVADAIVDYAVVAGTATTGADVEAASGSVTVPVGDTTATIEVDVEGDVIYEGDEDYTVELTNPFSVAITDGTGDGTITDDDPVPSIAIDDVTVAEGTGGTTAATFTITRTGETELPITFDVATADDSAAAGSDYQALAGNRTLAVGTATRTVTVNVMADAVDEDDETFDLAIANPGGATITDAGGVATIVDDDKAISSLTVKARKTATKVQARGILEPASGTSKVKVVLQKKVKKRWKAVASKRVGVTQIRDRDGDGYDDAMYRATLKRPAAGKYRFVVRTGATADATAALRTKAFRV